MKFPVCAGTDLFNRIQRAGCTDHILLFSIFDHTAYPFFDRIKCRRPYRTFPADLLRHSFIIHRFFRRRHNHADFFCQRFDQLQHCADILCRKNPQQETDFFIRKITAQAFQQCPDAVRVMGAIHQKGRLLMQAFKASRPIHL